MHYADAAAASFFAIEVVRRSLNLLVLSGNPHAARPLHSPFHSWRHGRWWFLIALPANIQNMLYVCPDSVMRGLNGRSETFQLLSAILFSGLPAHTAGA